MLEENLVNSLVTTALKQIGAGVNFKQPRLRKIKQFEDSYQLKVKKQLKNRFNIPLPILSGFVDTLKSKIDDAPAIEFMKRAEEDLMAARKCTALWGSDSSDDKGKWAFQDRQAKTFAIFSGQGVMKYWAESDPQYKSNLTAVDYYDFYSEPKGGAILENHLFLGQKNIFRTEEDLWERAESGLYIKLNVAKLVRTISQGESKDNEDTRNQRDNRQEALGLTPGTNNYVGSNLFNLTEHYMVYKGKRYYLLLDERAKIAVRAEELKEVFASNLWPFRSWATHEDLNNFLSKGPLDDVYPVSESMVLAFNEAMANNQKRNWGQRIYDPKIIDDPTQLQYRPDGIISANTKDGNLQNAIKILETPDTTERNMALISWLDNILGSKTGITPGSQGASESDKKVGIFFGELEQVADRLGLLNKSYRECWSELGGLYLHGLKEHLNEAQAVQIIGSSGLQWEKIKKQDIKDFGVIVKGGNSEAKQNELLSQKKERGLAMLMKAGVPVNPGWFREETLRTSGFEEADIKRASDIKNEGDEEIISEAMMAVKEIIRGKSPSLNRGATTGFMYKIIDEAGRNEDLEQPVFDKLIEYAMKHKEIVEMNMQRKADVQPEQQGINININQNGEGKEQPSQPGQGNRPESNIRPTTGQTIPTEA